MQYFDMSRYGIAFSLREMATIGSFTAVAHGYAGMIRTLTVNVKGKIVVNNDKIREGAPEFPAWPASSL